MRTRWARLCASTPTSPPTAVPLNVTALGIEFCVGGSVKWLCGGPGAAGSTCALISPSSSSASRAGRATRNPALRSSSREGTPRLPVRRGASRPPVVSANYAASAGYEIMRETASSGSGRTRCGRRRCSSTSSTRQASRSPRRVIRRSAQQVGVFRRPFPGGRAKLAARDMVSELRLTWACASGPTFSLRTTRSFCRRPGAGECLDSDTAASRASAQPRASRGLMWNCVPLGMAQTKQVVLVGRRASPCLRSSPTRARCAAYEPPARGARAFHIKPVGQQLAQPRRDRRAVGSSSWRK